MIFSHLPRGAEEPERTAPFTISLTPTTTCGTVPGQLLLKWRGKSKGDQPNSRCQQRLCLLRSRSSLAFNFQLLYAVKPLDMPYEDQIYSAAFSHQCLVEGLSVINDKLENGLKFILSILFIHPEGLVVPWVSLECPGVLQDFFCQ